MKTTRVKIFFIFLLIPIFFLEGCAAKPLLKHNFKKMFSPYLSRIDDNPIIIVPGIIGSRLVDNRTGKVMWGSIRTQQMFSRFGSGGIALPIDELPLEKNIDDISSKGIIDKYEFPVDIIEFTVYRELIQMFEEIGYKLGDIRNPEQGDNLYIFDYDWRRDNVENAKTLAERIEGIKKAAGKPKLKFNLICHSMGGLIGEYYMRYGGRDVLGQSPNFKVTHEGAKDIKKLILIGVPNLGSVPVFQYLHTGLDLKILKYPPYVIFTMPSIYQLLPARHISSFVDDSGNNMHIDLYDIENWKKYGWSMYSEDMIAAMKSQYKVKFKGTWEKEFKAFEIKRDRFIRAALERADFFHKSLNFRPIQSAPCEIILFGGDMVWTLNKVILKKDEKNNKWLTYFWDARLREKILAPGDSMVTKESLLAAPVASTIKSGWARSPLEISFALFVARDHENIHKDQAFQDNLLNILLAGPQ
ncbi:MAG: hypothetical protein PHI59_01430 [Candidatus Omnitrophica bacterium]|nr:hypothetical protein [Candidatus Omnitrophota bacterium]